MPKKTRHDVRPRVLFAAMGTPKIWHSRRICAPMGIESSYSRRGSALCAQCRAAIGASAGRPL